MKILIIRFSSIGDIVLTTPVLRAVKAQLGAEVHVATKKQYSALFSSNPHVDKVHVLDNDLKILIADLKKEKFDHILDLHHNLRSAIIKFSLGVHATSFDKLNYQKWLMVNLKINLLPDLHIVDRYLATARELGVKDDGKGLDYFIPEKDDVSIAVLPQSHQHEYVAYAIGGQHATKKLPLERMIELCEKIAMPIVLLGGPEDAENGEKIRVFFEGGNMPTTIFNGCGKFNLNQSASLLKKSARVFSHDTGLMHIAAALQKDVVAIWGNTIPEFGMTPFRTKYINLENKGLPCRPCSKIGYEKCPKGHFKCMKELLLIVI